MCIEFQKGPKLYWQRMFWSTQYIVFPELIFKLCVCSTGLHASFNRAFLRRCRCRFIGDDDSFNCMVMVFQNIARDPAFPYHMLGLWLCSLCRSKSSWDYKVLHPQRRSTGLLKWPQKSLPTDSYFIFNINSIELSTNRLCHFQYLNDSKGTLKWHWCCVPSVLTLKPTYWLIASVEGILWWCRLKQCLIEHTCCICW